MQNLFRIDRRFSRERTVGEQSCGLGLIVCRDMLHNHGCDLHIKSEEGKGNYYDLRFKDRFTELFGDLYIGQNPTKQANSYFVMNFDFSGLDCSDVESFKISFTETIRNNMEMFFTHVEREVFG